MTTIPLKCPHCEAIDLSKNGFTPTGKQRYLCLDMACEVRSFTLEAPIHKGRRPEIRAEVIRMASNCAGMRDIARTLEISRNTVVKLIKKKTKLPK